MQLTSTAFQNIEHIPVRNSGEGEDLSPPLMWSGLPTGTVSLALTCEDPDAPIRANKDYPFVHWVLYNLSPDVGMLPEGIPQRSKLSEPVACEQGKNSFGNLGYNGPMPPVGHGMHRYFFQLYALSKKLALSSNATREELVQEMQGCVLATAHIMGTYERAVAAKTA